MSYDDISDARVTHKSNLALYCNKYFWVPWVAKSKKKKKEKKNEKKRKKKCKELNVKIDPLNHLGNNIINILT